MSYQVLARKYRPHNFSEVVGQQHVLRALINALDKGRLHHAYLFTGTRGVGKTSLARLLAKCLNCEVGISSTPCNNCAACTAIDTGRFVDMLEVDAASRTKVEDTRELLDNVQYAPARGRFKVYLIDEVHMLSGHSFNALLKTLEEPPPHVKFLLATTDPQRLPVTVLSRCLQFNLKNLTQEQIFEQLKNILGKENIAYETEALAPLARAAQGSLRDALSLLDQAIAFSGDKVIATAVNSMLGNIEQTHIFAILTALSEKNVAGLLEITEQLASQNSDFSNVLEDLLTQLHHIAIAQAVPNTLQHITSYPEQIAVLAKQINSEDIQLFYQIALLGRRDLPLAPTPRSGFEMILLRMLAFQPDNFSIQQANKPVTVHTNTSTTNVSATPTSAAPIEKKIPTTAINAENFAAQWPHLIKQLNLSGMTFALANHCSVQQFSNDQLILTLDPAQAALHNNRQETRISEALSQLLGKTIRVQITLNKNSNTAVDNTPARLHEQQQNQALQQATENLQQDTQIQALMDMFDAKMQLDTIQLNPVKQTEE